MADASVGKAARLLPLGRDGLPGWCDDYLAPPGAGRFFSSRAWWDTVLAHAIPPGAEPVLAVLGSGAVLLPLLRTGRRLGSLTTPYTLLWEPLLAPGASAGDVERAGRAFASLLRLRPPVRLEALDPAEAALDALRTGARRAGVGSYAYLEFGNWHETLPDGCGWAAYLDARPPELRTTVRRKVARCAREMRFEFLTAPGRDLDAAVSAYEAVYARSWKELEPFPAFNAALMRSAAATGELRLGVLRTADGEPAAAQYWIVSGGRAWLLKLVHDEARRAASPGTALTAMMIRRLLDEEGGVTELDLGRGDDPYKRLWATSRRQRTGIMLFDPLHPAGLLEAARRAARRLRRSP